MPTVARRLQRRVGGLGTDAGALASRRPTAAPHAGTTLAAAGRHARWALGEGGCHSHGHRGRGLGATVPGAAGSPPTATAGHRRTPLRRTVDADEPLT